jgi:hypothetical protein
MGKTMMNLLNCREVTTKLALGDLSRYRWRERAVIRFHLSICWVCRKYEKQIKKIGLAFRMSIQQNLQTQNISKFKERLIHHLGEF